MLCYHFRPISIKLIIRCPIGGLILVILGAGGGGGAKIKRLFEKMSKLSYKLKSNCIKVVLKSHIFYMMQS